MTNCEKDSLLGQTVLPPELGKFFGGLVFLGHPLIDDSPLEIVDKTKPLGTIIEKDLSWDENIKSLVKKAYQRTTMLHYLLEYNPPIQDLLTIYVPFISEVSWNNLLLSGTVGSQKKTKMTLKEYRKLMP